MQKQMRVTRKNNNKQLAILALVVTVTIVFALVMTFLSDKLLCLNQIDCRVWGTLFSRSSLFALSGFFLFIVAAVALGKAVSPQEAKIARRILPFLFVLFLVGIYAGFSYYTVTTAEGIKSRDFVNGNKTFQLNWNDLIGYTIKRSLYFSYRSGRSCHYNYYVIRKDKTIVPLSQVVTNDHRFANYLNEKRLLYIYVFPGECE